MPIAIEERRLFARAQAGDRRAEEALLSRHAPIVLRVAHSLWAAPNETDHEDLIQEGRLALALAIRQFDPARGVVFITYAIPVITGHLKHYLRDMRPGKRKIARDESGRPLFRCERCSVEWPIPTGRIPDAPRCPRCEGRARPCLIAERLEFAVWADCEEILVDREAEDQQRAFIETEWCVAAVRELPLREQRILWRHKALGWSQTMIAEAEGISQMQVSRLLERSVAFVKALTVGQGK